LAIIQNEVRHLGPVRLELFSQMKSAITYSDFCVPIGTIDFDAREGLLRNSFKLFSFSYCDFVFEASIRDGMVFVMRNGCLQHSEQYLGDKPCRVAIQWTMDSIGCGVVPLDPSVDMNLHLMAVRTPITVPPADIVDILRKENLLYNGKYSDNNILFSTVIDALHCCEQDIRRHGSEKLYWNKATLNTLNEPDITRGVATILSIYGALKNFDVTCESIAGNGRIDFYISAPVRDTIGKIAIEAKKAESSDLVSGFETQLPSYMQRIGTDYGIYLVYWLKSVDYPFPGQFDSYAALEIEKLHPLRRLPSVRTIGLNLSREMPPSMR